MKFSGRTVTAIIEFPENKILLVKRDTVVFKGYWALPGGRVESEETVEQTVHREVKEETGLNIDIMLKMGEYHETGIQDGIEYDYYPACFLVKPAGGTIRRQEEEIEQIKIFNLKEIPENLAFEHTTMIRDYKRTKELLNIHKEISECEKCRLHETRTNAVPGEGPINARILICGQAPGRTEDREGRPFIGRSGKFLNELLDLIELERERLLITSVIKCFPPNNRSPRSDELKTCKPYLDEQIRTIKPKIIIALGNYAVQALLSKKVTVSKVHGKPQEEEKTTIFPTFHPAAAIRFPEIRSQMKKDFKRLKELLTNLNLA